ncbi:MAG: Metallo-dependent phosphatase-like protein [Piptocephalis tieghemiana]|nr:MAG: Metallo-dependent phosphatase-like protein [Piptocephalis tieghemiana]
MRSRLIVAIGDLHGDFDSAMRTFRMAGVVDEKLHWAGGSEMIFVQTGDIVDRGPDTIRLYTTLERLRQEAEEAGGEVIQVLGNHELMNLAGDLRYVTPEDTASFGGAESRAAAFTPTGFIGRHLFPLDLVHRVDRTIFAHGGINEDWAKVGALEINEETHRELPKYAREKDLMKQWQGWPIFAETGPAWYRGFALDPEAVMCPRLRRALRRLGVERMVVGHTFQESGRILSRCGGRFIVIDVGISRAYGGFAAALHIHSNGTVKAIYPSGQVDHTMKKDRKG